MRAKRKLKGDRWIVLQTLSCKQNCRKKIGFYLNKHFHLCQFRKGKATHPFIVSVMFFLFSSYAWLILKDGNDASVAL